MPKPLNPIQKAEQALRHAIPAAQADPLRPRYHFCAPANWMNDPNGTIFFNGVYHLFYQLNPCAARWGNIHWGQAQSTDLVHWQHLPLALAPDKAAREHHCFSGCVVIKDGNSQLFYTSINGRLGLLNVIIGAQQWRAFGDASLCHWQRDPLNPVVHEKLHDKKILQWRDPYIWQEDGQWLMLLCGNYRGEKGGSVFLYTSPDLDTWQFAGRLLQGSPAEGRGWECPNLLKLGGQEMLVVSPYCQVIYTLGRRENQHFIPNGWHTLDHGRDFYATNTWQDAQGYVLAGWVKVPGNGHWHGCLSLPRRLALTKPNVLEIRPIDALKSLRAQHTHASGNLMAQKLTLSGSSLEICAQFAPSGEEIGFDVDDQHQHWRIAYEPASNRFTCLNETRTLERVKRGEPLTLHIFIDQSVVEVFINYQETFTTWFKPQLAAQPLQIKPLAGTAITLDAWQLDPKQVIDLGCWQPDPL